MNKTIILLRGDPVGKAIFVDTAKELAWVWNINAGNYLGNLAKGFFWNGERDEKYYKFISELKELLNKYFNYEEKYLRKKIEDFYSDSDSVKRDKEGGEEYKNFLLLLHGVSPNLREMLKEEYGIFEVEVSKRSNNTEPPPREAPLYMDDPDFEEQIKRTIDILTKKG